MRVKIFTANNYRTTIGISFLLIITCILALPADGQSIGNLPCKNIETKVIVPLKPIRIEQKRIEKNECNFSLWYSANEKLSIYLENYESESKASEELNQLSELLKIDDSTDNPFQHLHPINDDKHWSEAIAYEDKGKTAFILIRKGTYVLNIFSSISDYKRLKKTEEFLRTIQFENF